MKNIIIDGVEYTPVVKETVEDNRHPWRYWYPEGDEMHYYINNMWGIDKCRLYAINSAEYWNCFRTQEEAEKELAKRKAIVTIKRYISDTFGVFEPDWSDNQEKWFLAYDHYKNCFDCDLNFTYQYYLPIWYLSCEKHALKIIEKFDAELRLIFDIK
jgi:hypothetical protein